MLSLNKEELTSTVQILYDSIGILRRRIITFYLSAT